jgi:predicted RNA binding protein YcfA (HicA-like mRNA interferase family)
MTKQDKIKDQFISAPRTLAYSKIQSFLVSAGYELLQGKGSHRRIKHSKS